MQSSSPVTISFALGRRGLGWLGLGSVAVILAGMVVAATPYRGFAGESYSPLNHFISELGEIAASRMAWAFNLGLVVGGTGLGLFALMLARGTTGRYRGALLTVSVAAGVSGTLVGVFPMDYHLTHRVVSGVFFLTGWLIAAIFTVWLIRTPQSGYPRWLALPGTLVVIVSWVFVAIYSTYSPADANARIISRPDIWRFPLLEWASLLVLLAWFACVAAVLVRKRD